MTAQSDAGLVEQLRAILRDDARKYEHARLPKDIHEAICSAVQRLEARGEISEAMVDAAFAELCRRERFDRIDREDVRAALESSQKGDTP